MVGRYFGITVWQGSAFDCLIDEIYLLHRLFAENARGECNDGSIVAQSLRVETIRTISRLNITVSDDLIGKNTACVHDDLSNIITVGSLIIPTGNC